MPAKHLRSKHRSSKSRRLLLETCEPRRLLALGVELVADVNTSEFSPSTNPFHLTEMNGVAFYSGSSPSRGAELWRSDGTAAGTALVKELSPGGDSSFPNNLTNADGTLYFTAHSATHLGLWRSDGTAAGTQLVKNILPRTGSTHLTEMAHVNGTVYFLATDGVESYELWKSDGTHEATAKVIGFEYAARISNLQTANDRVFFGARHGELWSSDGTTAGTVRLAEGLPFLTHGRGATAEANGLLFFANKGFEGEELWKTDGTQAGTQLVFDVSSSSMGSYPQQLTNVGGTIFFRAADPVHGEELWKSDGTAAGTSLVRDLAEGSASFDPGQLYNANGVLFFANGESTELWKSDGTAAGTQKVADQTTHGAPFVMPNRHSPGRLGNVGGTLFFTPRTANGTELWTSDGTPAGTREVKDIYPGQQYPGSEDSPANSSTPQQFVNIGGRLLFWADDEDETHLWTSDGTEAGTVPLDKREIWTRSGEVQPQVNLRGNLLFTAQDEEGWATWKSDGTAAGLQRLANTGMAQNFANINGTAYFAAQQDASSGMELWRTNGTPFGTRLVADINPAVSNGIAAGSDPSGFIGLNGEVLFVADDGSTGRELWRTDGTAEGTVLLRDIAPGGLGSDPSQMVRLGSHVYFTANDGSGGTELWRTDGTAEKTNRVKNISPDAGNSGPQELVVFQGRLYFTADDGVHGRELWMCDGRTAGTEMVRDFLPGQASSRVGNLTVVDRTLFFTTTSKSGVMTLWKSDWTAGGSTQVADLGNSWEFVNASGTLYFISYQPSTGRELWTSDGTAAGTRLVKDLLPGSGSLDPIHLQGHNGVLFFESRKSPRSKAYWVSDGTEAGTKPILTPGIFLDDSRFLTNVSGTLFFAGTEVTQGQELWKFSTAHPTVQFSGEIHHKENAPLRLVAPHATIGDADDAEFSGGQLSAIVQANASPGDRLEIRHQGIGPGQIGVDEFNVTFGGITIGSYRGELPGSRLIIDLNANATAEATQALLRNIGYRNVSENPSAAPRKLVVTLTDGSGGISKPISKSINVVPINDAPMLGLGGQLAYKNNSSPSLLAPTATVSDPDSANFYNGLLTVDITSGAGKTNRLLVGGAYAIKGDQLLRQGIVVGTVLESGIGWRDLRIRFNAQMNAAKAQELVRSLRFCTFENSDLSTRILSFTLTDGDGGVSATRTKTVNITN